MGALQIYIDDDDDDDDDFKYVADEYVGAVQCKHLKWNWECAYRICSTTFNYAVSGGIESIHDYIQNINTYFNDFVKFRFSFSLLQGGPKK